MLDLLRSIKGTDFLWMYSIYAVVMIFGVNFLSRIGMKNTLKGGGNYSLDPYTVSVLKNGNNVYAMLQIIVFKLFSDKQIEIVEMEKGIGLQRATGSTGGMNQIEGELIERLASPRSYASLMRDRDFLNRLRSFIEGINLKLIDLGLVKSTVQTRNEYGLILIRYLLILIPGIAKTVMGITYGKPVTYLILLMAAVTLIYFIAARPNRLTGEGIAYLNAQRMKFSWARSAGKNVQYPETADNPAMMAAFMGVAYMSMFSDYGMLNRTINVNPHNGGYTSGGCGSNTSSGCSSSSGSDSGGGSDGGGSGCGGGCGGCGGGD